MKYLMRCLKIVTFPIWMMVTLNTFLAQRTPNRFIHWLAAIFIYPIIGSIFLVIMSIIFIGFNDNSEKMETGIVVGLAILYFIPLIFGFFSPLWPGANAIHRERSRPKTFGDTRSATLRELMIEGLVGKPGIVFGRKDGKLVEKPAEVEGHVLIVGGPGTGKTTALAMPSLFNFEGGALAVDIKGELSDITAKYRKGGPVYIFDPFNGGDAYDPLKECKTLDGAQSLARTLIPEPPKGDPFWVQSAQGILAAALLEASHTGDTFCEACKRVCTTPPKRLIDELQQCSIEDVRVLSSVGLGTPDDTLGGILTQARTSLLTLAADEQIARATCRSDFTPADLEEGATIYLRIPEKMIEQYKELWAVILSQFFRHLSQRPEYAKPGIMVLLDEMPRLGEIPGLTGYLSTLRSRSVSILMLCQSISQLDLIYGQDRRKVIADTYKYKLVLSAADPDTQKYFSELAGQKTVHSNSQSFGSGLPQFSRSETGVPYIRPEEWARLKNPVLLGIGLQPVELERASWYKDKDFMKYA